MIEKKMCEYGCGREARYQMKNGKWCCQPSYNSCPQVRRKNVEGLKKAYASDKRNAKVIYQNSSLESKKKQSWSKGKCLFGPDNIFKKGTYWSTALLKKYLFYFALKEKKCESCGIKNWKDKEIVFQCHHIDGNKRNNELNNLQILCPNCHSQTNNFRGKNINGKREKYIEQQVIIQALKQTKNIRQALIYIGLAPKGGNYIRVKKIKEKYGL